jgi:hypothetical protein
MRGDFSKLFNNEAFRNGEVSPDINKINSKYQNFNY